MHGKNLMTTRHVAGLLGVTSQTVRNYVAKGKLHAIILPSGHRRFKKSDVEEFINKLAAAERKGEQC